MADTEPPASMVDCHRCGAGVHLQHAQAVTVDPNGLYQRWTRGRAVFYRRADTGTAPTLLYLCMACYRDRFGSSAQTDAERDERADHAQSVAEDAGKDPK